VLFHVIGTWGLPLIDRDEPRFAEASREMIERRDYVVPYFNNQLRLDKPPLTYWTQVASFKIFGENDFAARFPSAIAAALVALSIFAWGTRISGNRMGWWAAIIFTLSLQTFLHAKAAVADMWLVLFVTLAHWSGYELLRNRLSSATMEGHGGNSFVMYFLLLPFYFVTVFVSFFPWSIKLPWLAKQLWQRRDKIDNYLLTGAAIIFIIFTLVQTKLPHYTLPAF